MNNSFRVWCEDNKEWEKDLCVLTPDGRLLTDLKGRFIPLKPENHLIQFTIGVLDANEKLSFMGDILKKKISPWLSEKQKEKCVKEKSFYVIKKENDNNNMYLEYNFNIRGYWEKNKLELFYIADLEIVGNIFENSEILNQVNEE